MTYILALDQGTSSCRAIVFDQKGVAISYHQETFTQHFPKSGWVEHDPMEIFQTQVQVANTAIEKKKIAPKDIVAIGITNQRETALVWDKKSSKPIYPAIVWQDRRTHGICEKYKKKGLEKYIHEKTGLLLDPYFSATKLQWILEHVKGAKEKANEGELAFGTIDSWLIWMLTKGKKHVTDVTNASRTLLLNIRELKWDEELLEIFHIPHDILPEIVSSSEIIGKAEKQFFQEEIPIAAVIGDQQAALFGQTCFQKGSMKCTYGSGCFLLMNTNDTPLFSKHHLLTTVAWSIKGDVQYALEGSVFNAGTVIDWLRNVLGLFTDFSELDSLVKNVTDTQGVYFVSALTGLGAPHWNPHAKGALFGLSRRTERGHICRAALEGIAFQVADLIEVMKEEMQDKIQQIKVDGGLVSNSFLMQFQADVTQQKISKTGFQELTAIGAAYLAGIAAQLWKKQELHKMMKIEKTYQPNMTSEERERKYENWREALRSANQWKSL